jgi:glutamate/tyrosine decarboxylase-like PLP-dependent enzyme
MTDPDADRRAMRVYASAETHFSVGKAARALGVGLQPVTVDAERRLDPGALRIAIASDRAAGLLPICVVANAGTTSTGAVDPLDAVATVAGRREPLAARRRRLRRARRRGSRQPPQVRRSAPRRLAMHRRT